MKPSNLNKRDLLLLTKLIKEIKKLPGVVCIVQIGSSTYSKSYKDIDLIIFFNDIPPPELKEIRNRYKKNKFWIERAHVNKYKISRGINFFIKFFNHLNTKKILYGKNPYEDKKIALTKLDVASYIGYNYQISELYGLSYDNVLSTSLNAMLTYKNVFPKNKEETLKLFKETYPKLFKFLPKNPDYYLRKTNESNFKELYQFFSESLKFFSK